MDVLRALSTLEIPFLPLMQNTLLRLNFFMRTFWGSDLNVLFADQLEVDSVDEHQISITFYGENKEESERLAWCFEKVVAELCEYQEHP